MSSYDWGVETGLIIYGFIRVLAWPFIRVAIPKIVILTAGWLGQDLLRHYVDHHFIRHHDDN